MDLKQNCPRCETEINFTEDEVIEKEELREYNSEFSEQIDLKTGFWEDDKRIIIKTIKKTPHTVKYINCPVCHKKVELQEILNNTEIKEKETKLVIEQDAGYDIWTERKEISPEEINSEL